MLPHGNRSDVYKLCKRAILTESHNFGVCAAFLSLLLLIVISGMGMSALASYRILPNGFFGDFLTTYFLLVYSLLRLRGPL